MAKIKDINGDGKRNFKDTWLGEKLLGGGKTKGPNLKESMAGARRESSAAPMKAAAPKAKPTAAAKPVATKASSPKPAAKPAVAVTKPMAKPARPIRSGPTKAEAPVAKAPTPPVKSNMRPQGDAAKKILNDRWDAASKTDKPGMNFNQWKRQFAGKQFLPGQALKEYGDYVARTGKAGMAKGGMVSKKGKC